MPGVPFVLPHRDTVAIFRQQGGLIGGVAVGALPAGGLHKVSAQSNFSQVERAGSHLAAGEVGLTRMNRRSVDFFGSLVAAVVHEVRCFLKRVVAGNIDAVRVHLRGSTSHPVRQ